MSSHKVGVEGTVSICGLDEPILSVFPLQANAKASEVGAKFPSPNHIWFPSAPISSNTIAEIYFCTCHGSYAWFSRGPPSSQKGLAA